MNHANFDDCIPPSDHTAASNELIADDEYNYFHNSPHESDPSIQTTTIQDFNYTNLEDEVVVDSVPTSRIHKYHPQSNIIGSLNERITRGKNDNANICLY
ncbi:hypothetical protein QVD17_11992 [Tagetes erecta]|uniref:Uncharacterized protein n=1 Tax=Tagetes erecta TaxID=13708 RepID=A0AAD8KW71_TARER|nr:hypothetical protein QVD17_11992 [Tagetes erecta]